MSSEFLSCQDLVDMGLYASLNALKQARARKLGPKGYLIKGRVMYLKEDIISFLEGKMFKYKSNVSKCEELIKRVNESQ